MNHHRQTEKKAASLPASARLPVNRCNIPPVIVGSLRFQQHPVAIEIDNIKTLHVDLFRQLAEIEHASDRAERFKDYMTVHFVLHQLDEAGATKSTKRRKANYLRMVRGWFFDANSREGAVLKSWVESRFGLLTRFHHGPMHQDENGCYHRFLYDRSAGLYGTNALEAQLDLLYSYCQYELARQFPTLTHVKLYRGINRLDEHEVLHEGENRCNQVLLNNLNSFTSERERADEFGDYILEAEIPKEKIMFYANLLPGVLNGEDEHLVIGGVYEVRIKSF